MFWLHFALGIVLTALQAGIKNPGTLYKERTILLEIGELIDQVVAGIPEPPRPPEVLNG